MAAIRDLYGAAACSCAVVTEDGAHLLFVAADGAGSEEIVGVELPTGRGIAGWAAMSGQPLAARDVAQDSRFERDLAEATQYVPTSILVAPFFDRDGEVSGVLEVLDPADNLVGDWPLAALGTLAVQVAELIVAASPPQNDRYAELGHRVADLVRRTLA